MFTNTQGKGFCLQFANGWAVSVQWGPGNYCEHRNLLPSPSRRCVDSMLASSTAECAVINPTGELHHHWGKRHDAVKGYMTADEVAKLVSAVSRKKPV
jgi:hypothetical protein